MRTDKNHKSHLHELFKTLNNSTQLHSFYEWSFCFFSKNPYTQALFTRSLCLFSLNSRSFSHRFTMILLPLRRILRRHFLWVFMPYSPSRLRSSSSSISSPRISLIFIDSSRSMSVLGWCWWLVDFLSHIGDGLGYHLVELSVSRSGILLSSSRPMEMR